MCKLGGSKRSTMSDEETKIFLSRIHDENITSLTLMSACQIVRCHGDYLFCFQFVASNLCAIYYSHVMVCCLYCPLLATLVEFIRSHHLMEICFFFFS